MSTTSEINVVFQTRFSFYGQSGWKSKAAADPGLLFEPERLEGRFRYFEMIALPSLVAQADGEFTLMMLSSELMPEPFQKRLRELVTDTLGEKRVQVMFRPKGSAGQNLRNAVAEGWGEKTVAQVVLDDDDAVSNDFVEIVKSIGRAALDDPHNPDDYVFLSFPRGYTLGIEEGRPAWLERRFVPYTNLGLALVAPASTSRNPYMTSHKRVGQRHPSVMVTHRRPYYLRAVHGLNDSAAKTQAKDMRPEDMEKALAYFPYLRQWFDGQDAARKKAAE